MLFLKINKYCIFKSRQVIKLFIILFCNSLYKGQVVIKHLCLKNVKLKNISGNEARISICRVHV